MSKRELILTQRVDRTFEPVRDALLANPFYVFRRATAASVVRTARLHVLVMGFDVGASVAIEIAEIERDYAYDRPAAMVKLAWHATEHAALFRR